ncbi:MAG TPA: sugar ABC transporter permease [Clostridiales bacterium]|nr:sugar ABC transporter permease [Clostridiales bacterium]
MGSKKQRTLEGSASDISFKSAFILGNGISILSAIIFGIGNIIHKQIIRGFLYLSIELAYIYYMVTFGVTSLKNLITLGTVSQVEVFNEELQIYEYITGDNSMLCLLYGVFTIFVTLVFIFALTGSVKSAYDSQRRKELGKKVISFRDDIRSLKQENLHKAMLFTPMIGVMAFTIIPLLFMILIAFTNYDKNHQPPGNLFDWVGLTNFRALLLENSMLSNTFWPVLSWTFIWAIFATFSCYILGIILAVVINREGTRLKGFWRFTFVLSIAIPQFVSLLTMRTIFNANGPMNSFLRTLGVIGMTESIPFLTDPTLAKITIILVNIWIGVPFTLLTTTGILQNIPKDVYDAARVDGANSIRIFFKITMPYILFITTPNLITSFTGNINNFNVIYLLSGGGPDSLDYYSAGKTDLLVTWLYRLTITEKDYNLGSVIGILVFIILATLSLITYRRSKSFKEEEAFQ